MKKIKGVFLAAILTAVLCFSGNLWAYSGDGDGSVGNPYQIANVADFNQLTLDDPNWNKSFILTADVNLAGETLTPVGNISTPFTGVFDGNDNIISNAVINQPGSDQIGLFGCVGSTGSQIRNLGVEDVNMTGCNCVGGLVGYNYEDSLNNCYATGSVSGTDGFVGGLVGYNSGTLTACYATGSVSGTGDYVGGLVGYNWFSTLTTCYATGSVTGDYDVGGLVGHNGGGTGTLNNCYATGSVSGTGDYVGGLVGYNDSSKVIRCYSTGKPSGTSYIGGLCGYTSTSGSYEDTGNFWDTQTSQIATSAMGTGKTTAEMETLSTFTSVGWDFASVWAMPLGQYPVLFLRQMGDLNSDARVDMQDFAIFAENWLGGI